MPRGWYKRGEQEQDKDKKNVQVERKGKYWREIDAGEENDVKILYAPSPIFSIFIISPVFNFFKGKGIKERKTASK